jgi:putative oxidoreductase
MIPFSPILLLVATLFELLGGLSVLLGAKENMGAALLVLFLIPTTILMHQFWFIEGAARELQMIHFLKNLAILGGLLMIILQGTEKSKNSFPMKF